MEARPYIKSPKPYQPGATGEVSGTPLINEPGQVSFGVNDSSRGFFGRSTDTIPGSWSWWTAVPKVPGIFILTGAGDA